MLRFLSLSFLLSTSVFASYTRADVAFSQYLNFGAQQKEAVAITHPELQNEIESCSGVMFKGFVITAGHCVVDKNGNLLPNPDQYEILHGANTNAPDYVGRGHTVHLHPKYAVLSNGGRNYDVAIITLATPPTTLSTYGKLATVPPQISSILTGFGYGIIGNDKNGIISETTDQLLAYQIMTDKRYSDSDLLDAVFDGSLSLAGIAASGDSGGGLKNGNGEIVAITSSTFAVPRNKMPTNMQMIDLTHPEIASFIASNAPNVVSVTWNGSGGISNPANWSGNVVPQNTTNSIYIPTVISDATQMIVDEDLNIGGLTLSNPGSSITVNSGKTATFSYGLSCRNASINGILQANYIMIEGPYSSPSGFTVVGEGNVILTNGTINTSNVDMSGGRIAGTGVANASVAFNHQSGYLDPTLQTDSGISSGTITINSAYTQSGSAAIYINLFDNGSSDQVIVSNNQSSSLNFFLDFPDKFANPGASYTIFTASSGNTSSTPVIESNPLYTAKLTSTWQGNNLKVTVNNLTINNLLGGAASAASYVYSNLQNLRNSKELIPSSFLKKIRNMSYSTFYQSLSTFSNPKIHKELQTNLFNRFIENSHHAERVSLFLEDKRQSLDFKSFSFKGKDTLIGADFALPERDQFPLSFFISGDVYENMTDYTTDGLTIGGDYSVGSHLMGMSVHFKNKSMMSHQPLQEHHLNLYYAKRENFSFYDFSLGSGAYDKESSDTNIWGKFNSDIHTHQTRLDSRMGAYKTDNNALYLGYIGLSTSFSKISPFSTRISEGPTLNTSESSLFSLESSIGVEGRKKIHFDSFILEPSLQTTLALPLLESWKMPSIHFKGAPQSAFEPSSFSLSKMLLSFNFTLRVYIPQNTILKMELESVKECEEIQTKMFFGLSMKL